MVISNSPTSPKKKAPARRATAKPRSPDAAAPGRTGDDAPAKATKTSKAAKAAKAKPPRGTVAGPKKRTRIARSGSSGDDDAPRLSTAKRKQDGAAGLRSLVIVESPTKSRTLTK